MSYVDDIPTAGLQDSFKRFYAELSQVLLLKHLGELRTFGKDIPLLGRVLTGRFGYPPADTKAYTQEIVELLGLGNGPSACTTSTSSPTRKEDGTSLACMPRALGSTEE